MPAAPRARATSYVGRRRAVPDQRVERPRLLRGLGAVAALSIVAGAVGVTQALPQRAEAAAPASIAPDLAVTASPEGSAALAGASAAQLSRAAELRMIAVSRSRARAAATPVPTRIGSCDGTVSKHHFRNGRIPLSQLCRLPFASGHRLRADAAVALIRLNAAYRGEFGHRLCLTDSYRSYASQVSLAARKPGLAARPGTSEHGWGLAADLCGGAEAPGSTQHRWLRTNATTFGWDNPAWARPGGSRVEPWHWEYVAGE